MLWGRPCVRDKQICSHRPIIERHDTSFLSSGLLVCVSSGEVGLQRCNYRYTGLDTWHLIIPELEIAQNRRSARAAGYSICGRLIVSLRKLYSETRQLPSVESVWQQCGSRYAQTRSKRIQASPGHG